MSYDGEYKISGGGVEGWARSLKDNAPVWVEILADGLSLGCALCHLHGQADFWLPLPSFVLEEPENVRVRVANTEFYLRDASERKSEEKENTIFIGEIHQDGCSSISGWLVDKQNPDVPLQVIVYEKGIEVTRAVANKPHPLPEADGHAFTLILPFDMLDGQWHTLELRDQLERELPGSPIVTFGLPEKASQWLASRKRLNDEESELLERFVQKMENFSAATLDFRHWAAWKKVFPAQNVSAKKAFSLNIRLNGQKLAKLPNISNQQGCQIRYAAQNADYTLFIRPGEKLHLITLAKMTQALQKTGCALVYADGEDVQGKPLLKPAWDRDAFLARDYLGPFLVKGALEKDADGETDYGAIRVKLALAAEKKGGIAHIPEVLVLEKAVDNNAARVACIEKSLPVACESKEADLSAPLRVRYQLERRPKVSVLIPTRDQAAMLERCLTSLEQTAWHDMEIILLDNDTRDVDALKLLGEWAKKPNVKLLPMPGVFNYAAINNKGVEEAGGELLCFLNNDTEIIDPAWLEEMVSLLLSRPDNGCVGAKLLWPTRLVQHGGVVIGQLELAGHVGNGWLEDESGYMWRNQFAQQYSAVTAACMITPKALFQETGGFDARAFAVNFNDTDYCLRLRKAGKRVLWTPHARLIHHESASRGKEKGPAKQALMQRETDQFRQRWAGFQDPFYNPCLTLSAVNKLFNGLAVPPARREIRTGK